MSGDSSETHSGKDDKLLDTSGTATSQMSTEDKQTVLDLYQKNPLLWADFRKIVDFVDLLQQGPLDHHMLYERLRDIDFRARTPEEDMERRERIKFAVAVGFVECCVDFCRQIRSQFKLECLTEISVPTNRAEVACLVDLIRKFVNGSNVDRGFCLRLAKTDFVPTLLNDLKHMKHLAADVLETGYLYHLHLGIVINCCRHSDLVPAIRDMGAVDCVAPFMGKTTSFARVYALSALSFVAKNSEVELLQLDEGVFSYLVDKAWTKLTGQACGWDLGEILLVFTSISRLQSNRRVMTNDGFLSLLTGILQTSEEAVKELALGILEELVKDPDHLRHVENIDSLGQALKELQTTGSHQLSQKVAAVLTALHSTDGDSVDAPDSRPYLAELLADRFNVLSILGIGEVQFVLDHLHHLCTKGTRAYDARGDHTDDHTADLALLQGLKALTELALEGEDNKKEIIEKGGLETAGRCIKQDTQDINKVQRQFLVFLLTLSASSACCDQMKTHPDLLKAVEQCRQSASPDLSEMAEQILTCLGRHTV